MSVNRLNEQIKGASSLFGGDRALWIIIVILMAVSIPVVSSSTAKMTYDAYRSYNALYFTAHQIATLAFSFIALFIAHRINNNVYRTLARPLYIGSILLTLLAYVIGAETNGAARWIPLGVINFQPSEALKIATVLFVAQQLAARQSKIERLRIVPSWRFWTWHSSPIQRRIWREGTIPILAPIAISCVVIVPAHTSSAILVFMASLVMMYIGRVSKRELMKLVGYATLALVLLVTLDIGRGSTALSRIETWSDYWTKSQTEKPIEHLTDSERSTIAIHNGGFFGQGAGQSAIRVEMIHPESDFAYAFAVEEYGIIFAVAIVVLYLWIFFRAIEIFRRCNTAFPSLMVLGLALQITLQALIHIMVTLNIMPETGQTLPLVSRGGSSTLLTAIALGMILSVSRQNIEQKDSRLKR